MYGSNFCIVTFRPRSTSRRPSDAAAMPFPREETTPPVTKMYLVACGPEVIGLPLKCVPMGFRPSKVVAGVNAGQGRFGQLSHADPEAHVQGAELLQPLRQLGRAGRCRHPAVQRTARTRVNPDVLTIEVIARVSWVAPERDRRPGEVQPPPRRIGHYLDPRGVVGQRRIQRSRGS